MNKIFLNEIYIHIVIMSIILIFSFVACIYILFNDNYNTLLRIFSIVVLACIVMLAIKKETFLPFLGIAYVPNTLLSVPKYPQGANISYNIDMKDYEEGTTVIYWAATKTDKIIEDPYEAYKSFDNVGVTVVKDGIAEVRIFCPDKYKVKKVFTKSLEKHFHYRIVFKETGFLSPVMTVKVDC
jgi:predicted membrane channel-forming protein YqfA (hemolysin III family)